jgi:uncharacterized membrane protein YfhO
VLQSYYPGWQATVNGEPADLLRANVGFSAVPVAAGVNEVVLVYDSPVVTTGLIVSGAALLVVLALGAWLAWQRRAPASE